MFDNDSFRALRVLLLALVVTVATPAAHGQVPVSVTVPGPDSPSTTVDGPAPAGAPDAVPVTDTTDGTGPTLPRTGAAVLALALAGAALVLVGGSLTRATRRSPKEGPT